MKHWSKQGKEVSGIVTTSFVEDILNGMNDSLFDVYQYHESAKLLWETLEEKYMAEMQVQRNSLQVTLMHIKWFTIA